MLDIQKIHSSKIMSDAAKNTHKNSMQTPLRPTATVLQTNQKKSE